MDFLNENIGLVTLIGFIILTILSLLNIVLSRLMASHFSNVKFNVLSSVDFNTETGENLYRLRIHNHNINDVRVTSVGFLYKEQNIDYYQKYLVSKNLPLDSKIVIYTRDYMTIDIEPLGLKSIILDINQGLQQLKGLKVFVTDSLGITSYTKAKMIRKHIKMLILQETKEKEAIILEQKLKIKQEQKQAKLLLKLEKKQRRSEKVKGFMLRVKSIFKRKSK